MKRIILASGSPRRKELLEQIGVSFEIVKAEGEEIITTDVPAQAVEELSRQKAREVAERTGGDVVIGADTVGAAGGRILGKPESTEEAERMLELLQGGVHQVLTGVTVILRETQKELSFVETTKVHVYPMTEGQIRAYVETGEPMDKAGAYGIQGYGALLVEGIQGDYYNVMGLPVCRLGKILARFGVEPLRLAAEKERRA